MLRKCVWLPSGSFACMHGIRCNCITYNLEKCQNTARTENSLTENSLTAERQEKESTDTGCFRTANSGQRLLQTTAEACMLHSPSLTLSIGYQMWW